MIVDQIMAARNEKIDGALWSMHTRIHGKFRNALQKVYNSLSGTWKNSARTLAN
jgi:hypothetical protein